MPKSPPLTNGRSPDWTAWTHPRTQAAHALSLVGAPRLGEADLAACYALVEETSRADYEGSAAGWKPAQKRAEMRSPELRYLLVRRGDEIRGFTSLMPTYEEGQAVVYCYEIHLKPELQGCVFFFSSGFCLPPSFPSA